MAAFTKGKLQADNGVTLTFQFNPEEIEDKRAVVVNSVTAPGRTPAYIYSGMGDHTVDFELFFYGPDTQEALDTLEKLVTPRMENDVVVYPTVTFAFGAYWTIKGFIKGRSRVTSMFFSDLAPKMARVRIQFIVYQDSTLYDGSGG
jgi:hypothetical protein